MYTLSSDTPVVELNNKTLDLNLILRALNQGQSSSNLYSLSVTSERYLKNSDLYDFRGQVKMYKDTTINMLGVENYPYLEIENEYRIFRDKVSKVSAFYEDRIPLLLKEDNPITIYNAASRKIKLFKWLKSIKPDFVMQEYYDYLINDLQNKVVGSINESVYFDFTRSINWDSGDFGDDGSCYWSMACRAAARPSLENDSSFMAIRFYSRDEGNRRFCGIGRAWLLLNKHYYSDIYLPVTAFNFYWGDEHETYSGTKNWQWFRAFMLTILGDKFKDIKLDAFNSNDYEEVIYINSDRVYSFIDKSLNISNDCRLNLDVEILPEYNENLEPCYHCGDMIDIDELTYLEDYDRSVCQDCLYHRYFCCDDCGHYCRNNEASRLNNGNVICNNCLQNGDYFVCEDCGNISHIDMGFYMENLDITVCNNCFTEYRECDNCNEFYKLDDLTYLDNSDEYICSDCKKEYYDYCITCNGLINRDNLTIGLECLECANSPRLTITRHQLTMDFAEY